MQVETCRLRGAKQVKHRKKGLLEGAGSSRWDEDRGLRT